MHETPRPLAPPFHHLQSRPPQAKSTIEAQVVSWFWATDCYFSLEPFWFEEHRYPKGKLLKEKPATIDYHYQYGVNDNGKIIVERQYNTNDAYFYETFFFQSNNEIINYRFDYYEKIPISIQ